MWRMRFGFRQAKVKSTLFLLSPDRGDEEKEEGRERESEETKEGETKTRKDGERKAKT